MTKAVTREQLLVAELSGFYGVPPKAKDFVEQCVEASRDNAKHKQTNDQIKQAQMEEKIGELRRIRGEDEAKTPEQKALVDALEDANINVGVSFPDENSYLLTAGGQEDSGTLSAETSSIVTVAQKLVEPDKLS